MLFNKRLPLVQRTLWAIPPLFLLGFISIIYVGFVVDTAGVLLFATPPPGVSIQKSALFVITLAAIIVSLCVVPLLLSFWRAISTPAGEVPAWYRTAHESVAAVFRRAAENRYPRRGMRPPLPSLHRSGENGGIRVDRGSRVVLPAYFRGRTAGAEEYGDAASDDYDLEDDGVASDRNTENSTAQSIPVDASPSPLSIRYAVEAPLPPPSRIVTAILDGRYVPGPHDPRWCRPCAAIKAPRTHHCSVCNACTTKMDHHCPWVGNCVGWGNYKAFVLLLVWGIIATSLVALVWAPLMAGWWKPYTASFSVEVLSQPLDSVPSGGGRQSVRVHWLARDAITAVRSDAILAHIRRGASSSSSTTSGRAVVAPYDLHFAPSLTSSLHAATLNQDVSQAAAAAANAALTFSRAGTRMVLGFVLDLAFCVALLAFVVMHGYLIATGRTTLESALNGNDGLNPYDFGAARNAALVFGQSPLWWMWPTMTNEVHRATLGGVYFARCLSGGTRPHPDLERRYLSCCEAVVGTAGDDADDAGTPHRSAAVSTIDVVVDGDGAAVSPSTESSVGVHLTQSQQTEGTERLVRGWAWYKRRLLREETRDTKMHQHDTAESAETGAADDAALAQETSLLVPRARLIARAGDGADQASTTDLAPAVGVATEGVPRFRSHSPQRLSSHPIRDGGGDGQSGGSLGGVHSPNQPRPPLHQRPYDALTQAEARILDDEARDLEATTRVMS